MYSTSEEEQLMKGLSGSPRADFQYVDKSGISGFLAMASLSTTSPSSLTAIKKVFM